MEPRSQGQGKLEGEQSDADLARRGSGWLAACLGGMSEPAALSAPVTISIRQEPALAQPAEAGRERERRGGGRGRRRKLKISLQIGLELGVGTDGGGPGSSEVRGTAATAAESIWR